ncbi:MAG: Gfo/Idh/MocA family protein [Anaerolineales bacterium]
MIEIPQSDRKIEIHTPAKRLSVAVVGCGYFGGKRIQACGKIPDEIDLRAVMDADGSRAAQAGAAAGVPHFTDLDALLNETEIDAIILAVPNNMHGPMSVQALEAGKHVLCEKPLATRPSEAERIVDAVERCGKFVKTASNHRFFPTVTKAYELYTSGRIGEILSFRGAIGNDGGLTHDSWFWKKDVAGGGTFIDNACHLLDIARMFMGDFSMCLGQVANLYWKQAEVEDYATGIFVTEEGRQALITSSWTQWTGYFYFELWGDAGYIFVDSRGADKVTVGDNHKGVVRTYDFGRYPITSHQDELSYFAKSITMGEQPVPSAADGLEVIKMIDGVYRSTAEKTWVNLTN